MTIEQEVSGELPNYLFAVVADSDPRSQVTTAKTIRFIAPSPNWNIQKVRNYEELFDKSLHGDVAGGSKLVVLDDDYTTDWEQWVFSETERGDQMVNMLLRRGMSKNVANQYTRPESVNFAAALRLFGYDQKIIIVSNKPPSESMIETIEKKLRLPKLIDGISLKGYRSRLMHTVYRQKTPDGIKLVHMSLEGDLTDSLSWLLPKVLG